MHRYFVARPPRVSAVQLLSLHTICNALFYVLNRGCELIVRCSECLFELSGIDCNWTSRSDSGRSSAGTPPAAARATAISAAFISAALGCTAPGTGIGGTTMPGATGGAPRGTPRRVKLVRLVRFPIDAGIAPAPRIIS
jgi:hypothetical protein